MSGDGCCMARNAEDSLPRGEWHRSRKHSAAAAASGSAAMDSAGRGSRKGGRRGCWEGGRRGQRGSSQRRRAHEKKEA